METSSEGSSKESEEQSEAQGRDQSSYPNLRFPGVRRVPGRQEASTPPANLGLKSQGPQPGAPSPDPGLGRGDRARLLMRHLSPSSLATAGLRWPRTHRLRARA